MSKQPSSERRSFLTRLNVGVASLAIGLGRSASAQVKSATPTRFEPARHEKDDWMDEIPGKHRLIFDTVYPAGLGDALLFATNFMLVNRNDYGQFEDPKTHAAPEVNTYAAGMLGQLAKQGVQFAVCSSATRRVAGAVAQAVSGKADDINAELIANLVPNARMVPAGIVAMSRAQERGYTLSVSDRMS
jgi:intracellular sulfur oxidation DsrE/DsrF family protein